MQIAGARSPEMEDGARCTQKAGAESMQIAGARSTQMEGARFTQMEGARCTQAFMVEAGPTPYKAAMASEEMLADALTKALDGTKSWVFVARVG
jgi:hypothetical protein